MSMIYFLLHDAQPTASSLLMSVCSAGTPKSWIRFTNVDEAPFWLLERGQEVEKEHKQKWYSKRRKQYGETGMYEAIGKKLRHNDQPRNE